MWQQGLQCSEDARCFGACSLHSCHNTLLSTWVMCVSAVTVFRPSQQQLNHQWSPQMSIFKYMLLPTEDAL